MAVSLYQHWVTVFLILEEQSSAEPGNSLIYKAHSETYHSAMA